VVTERSRAESTPCQWISGREAFRRFATHAGGVQSAKHIKPLHWYIACRLVLEGGFHPDEITPRPPFAVTSRTMRGRKRSLLSYDPALGGTGEQIVLGGLKTKNVDVVISKPGIGPVMAVSCKGATKAFRNLSNRMEETIGECTNLHITYPALVIGYFALLRANRTVQDALDTPDDNTEVVDRAAAETNGRPATTAALSSRAVEQIAANDIAILSDGSPAEGIVRFHAALSEMTARRGIRDEISRYESMSLALVEPTGTGAGAVFPGFPPAESPLHLQKFFQTLYQRYEERFVYGAPLLADRGITPRMEWAHDSPVFLRTEMADPALPELDFTPRMASA
jgi:hypothetical protein